MIVAAPALWAGLALLVVLAGMIAIGGLIAFQSARRLAARAGSPLVQGALVTGAMALAALGVYPLIEWVVGRGRGEGPGAALGGVLLLSVGIVLCANARKVA